MELASCATIDPELWYPKAVEDSGRVAKWICRRCPVMSECLQYALDNDEVHGIWGGLNRSERLKLRKRVG
jgi:WhiB family transcriptional regulator, redox-sensing transcriptional regulator